MVEPEQKLVVDAIIPYDIGGSVKYLMVKVRDGRLGFPGGKIEFQEDPRNALVREVREETGVEIVPLSLIDLAVMNSPRGNHIFRIVYEAQHVEGVARAANEVSEIGYLSLGEIRQLDPAKLRGKNSIVRPLENLLRGKRLPLDTVRNYVDDYHPLPQK